jgi:hypothetical protein
MESTVEITFTAPGRPAGPLTWSQRLLWFDTLRAGEDAPYFNVFLPVPVPPGCGLDDVLAALTALVVRHEVLRSRFYAGPDGEPYQEVRSSGAIAVTVADGTPDRLRQLADEYRQRLESVPFRFPAELPIRVCVLTTDGQPAVVLLVVSHTAIDAAAAGILRNRLTRLLTGRSDEPVDDRQPLDRAGFERSPAGRRLSGQTLAFLDRLWSTAPHTLYPVPRGTPDQPRFWRMMMRSPALTAALRIVAARARVSSSDVLMAAVATVIGRLTGNGHVLLRLILSNRGYRDLQRLVCPVVGNGYVLLDVDRGSFQDLLRATARASLRAQTRSQCDPVDRDRLLAAVNDARGIHLDLSVYFNDSRYDDTGTRPSGEDLDLLRQRTELSWDGRWDSLDATFFVLASTESGCDRVHIMVDTTVVPRDRVAGVLRQLEDLVIRAARADLATVDPGSLTDIVPPHRDRRWHLVDNCWVHLDAATAAVRAAVPGVPVAVHLDTDGGAPRLVAHVAAGAGVPDPAGLHRAVLRVLPAHPAAIAPAEYVVHAAAPERTDLVDAWRTVPVVARSSGRDPELARWLAETVQSPVPATSLTRR